MEIGNNNFSTTIIKYYIKYYFISFQLILADLVRNYGSATKVDVLDIYGGLG